MYDDIMRKLDRIEPLLEYTTDEELKAGALFLAERINHPDSYVTFLGETSSGKSTIINGLLGEKILPVKASPTTGAITEVELCPQQREDYYAINKDASIELIDKQMFISLSEKPDNALSRVKLCKYHNNSEMSNMRIFDTPGYGSIVEEHEEILKEFLPNSDIVIYTVSYKIGIQEDDYSFLGFLGELVREDTEVVLVVNMCPSGVNEKSSRITEIQRYAGGILGKSPKLFCVPFIRTEGADEYPLPEAEELWKYISDTVNSPEHRKRLYNAFDEYVTELYRACDSIISMKYAQSCMDNETLNELINEQRKSAAHIRKAIPKLIEPAFSKISERLPELFDRAADNVISQIEAEIDAADTGKKDEMIAFINSHYLPFYIKQENKEINNYLELQLTELNNNVNDYINKEIADFSSEVNIRLSTYTDEAVKNISGKIVTRLGTNILKGVFLKFGGVGGANAGIANAASHLLKKIGDVFGKTFSRETHNALKHFLAKIGATSMKAVSAAIAVVIELAFVAVDYATWKSKLKKRTREGIENWKNETVPSALKELENLKLENINNINVIANDIENCFSDEFNTDSDETRKAAELSKNIGKEIGVL